MTNRSEFPYRNSSVTAVRKKLKTYVAEKRANISMIAALSVIPILVTAGGAMDVGLAMKNKNKMQQALDGAIVAATNLRHDQDAEQVVRDFILANLEGDYDNPESLQVDINVQNFFNGRKVEATVMGAVETNFLPLIGLNEINIAASSTASQYVVNTEISLVLDISSSMKGSRINALRPAVHAFIDDVFAGDAADYTSINLIPFGGSVNIGPLFDRYVVPLAGAIIDPDDDDYVAHNPESQPYRFTDGGRCLEHIATDFRNTNDLPLASYSQVPSFWAYNEFIPWCPTDDSAIMLNSNDADALKAHVDGLSLSDGTGTNIGMMWGLKALSPQLRGHVGGDFSNRPLDFSPTLTNKVIVVMSDGGTTAQLRPRDYTRYNIHSNRGFSDVSTIGIDTGAGRGNDNNSATSTASGNINSGTARTVGRFLRACEEAKAEGIVVFSIGFQINQASNRDILRECATSDDHFFEISDLNISQAFNAIAAQVESLRIEF